MPTIAVDSGTLHLATVDGGAMFFHDSLDFSAYAGTDAGFTPYKVTFTDAAGKTAEAWAAAVGGGEALGSNAITSITNRADLPYDTLTINANGFDVDSGIKTQTAARAVAYTNDIVMLGKLWKVEIAFTLNSGTAPQLRTKTGTSSASRVIVSPVVSGAYYWTGFDGGLPENGFVLRNEAAEQSNWSAAWTAKQYTDVPATGLHLMSASGGTTRNMDTVEAGFDPNTVVSVELEPIRLFVDITEAESTALESLRDNTTVAGWDDSDGWVEGDGTYDGKAASTSQITVTTGAVTALDLRANNLDGEFTAAVVSALTSCATIHVEGNPNLNVSFDLDDLPASVTDFVADYTDSDLAGGSSAMSAVDIEEISIRSASLNTTSIETVINRVWTDRGNFNHATPILRIDNLEDETLAYIATHGVSRTPAEIAAIDTNIKALKAGTPVVLSSLTAKLSTVDGTAFVTQSSVDLRPYKDFKLSFSDGSQALVGWGGSYGTGETLGVEEVGDPGFDDDGYWSKTAGFSVAGSKAIATGITTLFEAIYRSIATMGRLYRTVYSCTAHTSGNHYFMINNGPSSDGRHETTGTFIGYKTSMDTPIGIRYGDTGTLTAEFDDISLKQVLTPDTSGLTIVSASGGSTYNWTSDGGINPNAASFTLTITNS